MKGIATIACIWTIPTGAKGKLVAWMRVSNSAGGYAGSAPDTWRVK